MGGKSSSSSSSSTSQSWSSTTNTHDYRMAQEQGAIGANNGSTINITDAGAIEAAAKFAEQVAGIGAKALETSETIVSEHTAVLAEQVEDNAKEISETLIKSLMVTTAIIGVAFAWGMRKK